MSHSRWLLFAASAAINAALLWHFHDRYWYPTDDGLFANIAERLLSGEVLIRDVQDIHPGYVHFLNAAAFRLFSVDLVSLRYPLITAALLQGCLLFALLQHRGPAVAATGSIAGTALGVIQFVNPTPNWYCLFLCVALIWWITWLAPQNRFRLLGAGVLLGVLALLRQLTGVWVAMALLVVALFDRSDDARGRQVVLARGVISIMAVGLVSYVVLSPETEPGGVLLMAVWPMGVLVWAFIHVRTSNAAAAAVVAQLLAGVAFAALPLVVYLVIHHSFGPWIRDTVLAASGLTQMPFFGRGWYGVLPLAGAYQVLSSGDAVKIANGLYWVAVPLASAVNGVWVLIRLRRGDRIADLRLPVFAVFYALVSLFLEGPLYLYYTVGLSLASLLWLASDGSRMQRGLAPITAVALSLVAVVFHAGQSRLRTASEILAGYRYPAPRTAGNHPLARCSLRLDDHDRKLYGELVQLIPRESQPNDSILALPNDAELYFLAERRNPVRFYNSAFGIRTADDLRAVIDKITEQPPRLVFYQPDDKYDTPASRRIAELVRTSYTHLKTRHGLEIYKRPSGSRTER